MNRTRTYECMCLLDNREVRKGWEPLKESVAALFSKHDAKVLSNRRWDERRLAYSIKGHNRATYLLVYFSADTQIIPALRRELEFSESMLRYMITDCPELPAEAHEPEAEFDVDAIPQDDAPDVPEQEGDEGSSDEDSDDEKGSDDKGSDEKGSDDGDSDDGDEPKAEAGDESEGDADKKEDN